MDGIYHVSHRRHRKKERSNQSYYAFIIKAPVNSKHPIMETRVGQTLVRGENDYLQNSGKPVSFVAEQKKGEKMLGTAHAFR